MREFSNIAALKATTTVTLNEEVYVKGFNTVGDGGGGMFVYKAPSTFAPSFPMPGENNGTIIKSVSLPGVWFRQYSGYIDIRFFGALGSGDDTAKIQAAIDFATDNTYRYMYSQTGNVVYIPTGVYTVSALKIKRGVSLMGGNMQGSILKSKTGTTGYLLSFAYNDFDDPDCVTVSNLTLEGNNTAAGGMLFEGKPKKYYIAFSIFRNIRISGFQGHGLYLMGGSILDKNNSFPNQFLIFENIRVTRAHIYSNALKMTGQNGQITFFNCTFDGFYKNGVYAHGEANIAIFNELEQDRDLTSGVVSFINCGSRDSQYGVSIKFAENITFDNCMFRNLGMGITTEGDDPRISKSINILNCHFYDVGGFGMQTVTAPNINHGDTIQVRNSEVNVKNNYLNVLKQPGGGAQSSFLMVLGNGKGVNASGNNFGSENAAVSLGVVPTKGISSSEIDCVHNAVVYVSNSGTLSSIASTRNAGETITLKANQGNILIAGGGNIILPPSGATTIPNGGVAVFVKIDKTLLNFKSCYILVSVRP